MSQMKKDPTHKKIMQTRDNLIDVDFLDREEALYSAVEKRKFLFKCLLDIFIQTMKAILSNKLLYFYTLKIDFINHICLSAIFDIICYSIHHIESYPTCREPGNSSRELQGNPEGTPREALQNPEKTLQNPRESTSHRPSKTLYCLVTINLMHSGRSGPQRPPAAPLCVRPFRATPHCAGA